MNYFNHSLSELMEMAKEKRKDYANSNPFPSIYFDDFFNPEFLNSVLEEASKVNDGQDGVHYSNANEEKYASKGESKLGNNTLSLIRALNSEFFLGFLQEITGIERTLIPDPYLEGGGLHEIKPGGFLKIHVDFHRHKGMNLDRRLNVLVFLNKDWEESYGGHFELWDKDMKNREEMIAPLFNRMVIFSTTGSSWHGHPEPLTCPPERTRKSLALYYYTNGRPSTEVSVDKRQQITTTFGHRAGKDSFKMLLYNNFVNLAVDLLPPIVVRTIKKRRNT